MPRAFIFEPLNLFTGNQGAAKTLFAIEQADLLRQDRDGAKVYQLGVNKPDTRYLPQLPFKVSDMRYHDDGKPVVSDEGHHEPMWTTLPVGSVVIVDEAHQVFPQRGPGRPPRFVEAMAESRRHGIRWLLITQAPESLDSFLRGRINRHFHLERRGGMGSTTFYEFENRVVGKEAMSSQKRFAERRFRRRHPKKYYSWYESAKAHFFRFSMPLKVWAALALIPCVLFVAYLVVSRVGSLLDGGADGVMGVASAQASKLGVVGPVAGAEDVPVSDAQAYLLQFKPLVPTMPVSAPAFAHLPVLAEPRLFCVGSGVDFSAGCSCYTEQATPYELHEALCRRIAEHGLYEPHRAPLGHGRRSEDEGGEWGSDASVSRVEPLSSAPSPVVASDVQGVASYGGFRP